MKFPQFAFVFIFAFTLISSAADSRWGSYRNRPLLLQDLIPPDGRHFSLGREFAYVDQTGRTWIAPKDLITDGASIPMPFWSVIGGPFEGLYREAAIVHDAGCCAQMAPWQDVHHMFYNAMRCSGVGWIKAKTMFFAVWARGPRWKKLNTTMPAECKIHPTIDSRIQSKLMSVIQSRQLSISESRAVARPFFSTRAMTDADAVNFVADLRQRKATLEESYAITFSVIQSAQFSDDDVRKTEEWIQKENPALEVIEARAEQTRKGENPQQWIKGLSDIYRNGAAASPLFPDVQELVTQSLDNK